MESKEYLNNLLEVYKSCFDIEENIKIDEYNFSAYGYFNSKAEKYILVKEVNLWEVNNFEYIFFLEVNKLSEKDIDNMELLIKNKIEKDYVRKGEKYPPKNHMTSYISIVFISSNKISENIKKKIEKFKFEKTYLFSIRGFLTTRFIGIDLKENKIYYNKPSKEIINVFEKNLKN
ncbi:hypothetical protein [Fusobacterium perfoetens]|uniref:hypothetical protein n=1 Tax=Fusobacterium perfoetens TaxID=852 RepID=UPI0004870D7A|nr:hypothetical protein [Fusobacterium perfoetens]MCI6152588.1 hypothetical protein [Fusobacterium perfoetens]MDY3237595.1 hypothetical protein [Fusobacterium perfoetens]